MTRLRTALAGVTAVAVAFQAIAPLLPDAVARAVSDVLIALAVGSAAVTYLRRVRREATRRARAAVLVGGLAAAGWAIANALFFAHEIAGVRSLITPAVCLSVGAALLLPLGVHLLTPPVPGAERYRRLIDVSAVAGATYAVAWIYLLEPARHRGPGGLSTLFATLATGPELAAAAVALVTMSRNLPTRGGRVPRLLGATSVILAVTGIAGLRNTVDGRQWYSLGVGAGYLLAAGVIAVTCHLPTPRPEPAGTRRMISGGWAILPYVPILLAVAASAAQQIGAGVLPPVLVWVLLATFLLVLLRQFLTVAIVGRLAMTLEANQAELAYQADHDSLTGLPNRSCFHRRGGELLAAHPESSVLLLDLDGFKPVNDALGHAAGDEVLRVVAARLAGAVRPDDLVARLGGDEFVLVLAGEPDAAAARIREAIAAPIAVGGTTVRVGASIGLATARPGAGLETLVREADAAMYAAKATTKAAANGRRMAEPRPCETSPAIDSAAVYRAHLASGPEAR
jgi:diguanylate cyclase (GGDEF)-like protein